MFEAKQYRTDSLDLIKQQLKGNSEVVKNFLRVEGVDDLNGLYLLSSNRITIIKSDGEVLFDSASNTKESHRYRAEVKEALADNEGFEVRFSTTLGDKLIYYSVLYEDVVIRIADSYSAIEKKIRINVTSRILSFIILNVVLFFSYKIILRKYYFDKLSHMRSVVESGKEAKEMYLEEDRDLVEFWHVIKDWQNKNLENIERLNEEKEKLQKLISSIDIGILLLDNEGVIKLCNREARYNFFNDFDTDKFYEKIKYREIIDFLNKIIDMKQEITEEIFVMENRKSYVAKGKYLVDSNKFIVTIKDITQSKELEKIEKKFISNISHELKTPLTNIKGYLIAIEEEEDRDMQKTFLNVVYKNIEKMENIIGDFLNLQKLESSKILNKYPIDIKVVFDEVLRGMDSIIDRKNALIKLDMEMKSKDDYVNIDKEKIKTLLKNLIENALIYNDKSEPEVEVKVEETRSHLRFSVKDNGIGLPEKEVKNIFNRFYRVDKSRTTNEAGTGLGLSLVKEIVDLYSGNIQVQSEEGKGTEFIIRIVK